MLERQFKPDMLYNKVVHFYIDKRGYDKTKANKIAQLVVQREAQRRTCKCKHLLHDHVRNVSTCLVDKCECTKFAR